jgi:hypothetical protein
MAALVEEVRDLFNNGPQAHTVTDAASPDQAMTSEVTVPTA